jgi:hypothetical protein
MRTWPKPCWGRKKPRLVARVMSGYAEFCAPGWRPLEWTPWKPRGVKAEDAGPDMCGAYCGCGLCGFEPLITDMRL